MMSSMVHTTSSSGSSSTYCSDGVRASGLFERGHDSAWNSINENSGETWIDDVDFPRDAENQTEASQNGTDGESLSANGRAPMNLSLAKNALNMGSSSRQQPAAMRDFTAAGLTDDEEEQEEKSLATRQKSTSPISGAGARVNIKKECDIDSSFSYDIQHFPPDSREGIIEGEEQQDIDMRLYSRYEDFRLV
jgi:hypothetical protein